MYTVFYFAFMCDRIKFCYYAFHLMRLFDRQKRQPGGNASNGNFNAKPNYNKPNLSNDSKPLQLVENPVKLLELRSRHDEHIVCAALSSDARWLTYSTESIIRLYSLKDVSFLFVMDKSIALMPSCSLFTAIPSGARKQTRIGENFTSPRRMQTCSPFEILFGQF